MIDRDDEAAFQAVVNVSRETIERLKRYELLLAKWNPTINLVSRTTLNTIWQRHFIDSAQLWALRPKNTTKWLDLGSGGGFPGLVIAILAAELAPDLRLSLVESDARKASFLLTVVGDLKLAADVYIERAETLQPQNADVITARALAPLSRLFDFTERHAANTCVSLFSKGKSYENELTEARKYWTFRLRKTPSITDQNAVILAIESLRRA